MENGTTQAPAQAELEELAGPGARHRALFLEKIQQSNEAIQVGDFSRAVKLYSEAIQLDPSNHILYSNRSAAYIKVHQYKKGLEDAQRSRELNSRWSKAYLREGVALQCLGQHGDALVAFARGLSQDPTNTHLLQGITEAAVKSPLKAKLEPVFQQLQKMKLDKSPFVVISVIGQELLAASHYSASIQVLEAALKIGSCSMKLRGSVFSALSSAHWGQGSVDQAIMYMQQDLTVARQLGDQEGECRVRGNLGAAYFSKGHYKEALSNHRFQLVLAMKLKERKTASSALSSLGHVYTAIGDYPNALASHKQCVILVKQSNDKLSEGREIGNVGAVFLAMGNFDSAVECHVEHLKLAKKLKSNVEEARAYSNLGSAYHYKRDYVKAIGYHQEVLKIAEMKNDNVLEARAYAGLGHAARCTQDYAMAKKYHESQLDNALKTKDRAAEGRACSNLGIIFHQIGEHDAALKLHKVHVQIAEDLGDKASQGRALGNMGIAYSALGQHEMAVKLHKQELTIAAEVNDRHSEGATHGNMAVAYQALGISDKALQHYMQHLNISRELHDTGSEARVLCNIGNFYSSKGEFSTATPYYEQYLELSQELQDLPGEAKACFNLGYAHFCLGNYLEAVRYYEQDLSLGRETKDKSNMARAYCNLGLAHKALENFDDALECQKKFLSLAHTIKNVNGKFRALGNIGDILMKMDEATEAIKMYQQQLQLAKQCSNQELTATAYGALGAGHRILAEFDKALEYHKQELTHRQELSDLKGECRAHGNLGNVQISLGNFQNAYKCYEVQLEKSGELGDAVLESQASGNLGITKMNLGQFEDAIGMFEQQLALLEQASGPNVYADRGKAYGNLGDSYEALGDFDEAVKCYEQYLSAAQKAGSRVDQDKAYRGLGNGHRSMGNLQQALVCFEKRLVVAHELDNPTAKASAYGELGCLHSILGNFEQAVSCLEHQMRIAEEIEDKLCEGDAACGLGGVYQQMGEYDSALKYHQMDLQIAEITHNAASQCRAFGNLGLSHESLGNYEQAIRYQEQHLSLAAQMNDRVAKTLAYSSLGRVHHALGNYTQAVQYLQQGLQIAEQLCRREDEAKIRHRLGLALWGKADLEECQHQLYKAAELFENIRRESQVGQDYKLSLFDLQTASYQALQRVLVSLSRHEEALLVAERGCTRAFVDLLMERQSANVNVFSGAPVDMTPVTVDQLIQVVRRQKSVVLCFSVALGFLYSWLITPSEGVVKFHQCSMAELEWSSDPEDSQSLNTSSTSISILDQYIGHTRETLGVESHLTPHTGLARSLSVSSRIVMSETESEADDVWQQQLEELGEKLNAETDRTGFLRMVNRNQKFNSSNYSLSSLFSLSASLNGMSASGDGGKFPESNRGKSGGKTPTSALYELLIRPMEDAIASATEMVSGTPDLVLVLQGDLFLVPFPVLKAEQSHEFLFERFNLMVVPSITSLNHVEKLDKHGRPLIDSSGAVVIGNPKLPPAVRTHWLLKDLPGTEFEANIVGELLTSKPLIGAEATKEAFLQEIEQAEVVHLATHISWRLSAIVLSPSEMSSSSQRFHHSVFEADDLSDNASDISSIGGPSISDFLLTAADILNLELHAKLVVLSSGYTDDRAGRINADGVVGLTRSLLSAGAQCVMYSLWPVPDQAAKLLMRTFYTALQQGCRVTQALTQAIRAVQTTRQFSHPSNWGGWVLVGRDVKLSSKVALMGHAICELLQYPNQCREAMRVLLHLIEKSLQRIHQGIRTSMYTTYQSVENKVGRMTGWKDLLQAVGFRFDAAKNGLPASVFFPQTDPGDRLTQASASLQALLGLPASGVPALAKFLSNYEAGEALMTMIREVLGKLTPKVLSVQVPINVKLWQVDGVHEFLASLGFDLLDVGKDEVTVRMGKQANRRHLQFALQSLVSVFDTQEAPRSLTLDSSSSLESLSSSHSSSTSTSNFSKGSTPPLSPRGKKRSLFNPAEMEKIRSVHKLHLMNQGGLVGRTSGLSKSNTPNPSLYLSHQSRIRSMYRTTSANDSLPEEFCMDDSSSQGSSPISFHGDLHELPEQNLSYHENVHGRERSNSQSTIRSNSTTRARSTRYSSSSPSEVDEGAQPEETTLSKRTVSRDSLTSQGSSTLTSHSSHSACLKKSSLENLNDEAAQCRDVFYNLDTHSADSGSVHIPTETETFPETQNTEQSDHFAYDPEQIAKIVLAEVGRKKQAVESMQKINFIESQQNSFKLRRHYSDSPINRASPQTPTSVASIEEQVCSSNASSTTIGEKPSAFRNVTIKPDTLYPSSNRESVSSRLSPRQSAVSVNNQYNHARQDSGHGRSGSGSESERGAGSRGHTPVETPPPGYDSDGHQNYVTVNTNRKVPPPVPSKPRPGSFSSNHDSRKNDFRNPGQITLNPLRQNHSGKVYDTSVDSTDSGIVDDRGPQSLTHQNQPNPAQQSVNLTQSSVKPPSPRKLGQFTHTPNQGIPKDFSRIHPMSGQDGGPPRSVPGRLLSPEMRPESSASTSSQCSTTSSSSVQTVIYNPADRTRAVAPTHHMNSRNPVPQYLGPRHAGSCGPTSHLPGTSDQNSHRQPNQTVGRSSHEDYTSSDTDASDSHRNRYRQRTVANMQHHFHVSVDSSDTESVDNDSNGRTNPTHSYHPSQRWPESSFRTAGGSVTRSDMKCQSARVQSVHDNVTSGTSHDYRPRSNHANPAISERHPQYPPYPHSYTPRQTTQHQGIGLHDQAQRPFDHIRMPHDPSRGSYRNGPASQNLTNPPQQPNNANNDRSLYSRRSPDHWGASHNLSVTQARDNGWSHDNPPTSNQWSKNDPYQTNANRDSSGRPNENIQLQNIYMERAQKALPKGAVLQSSKC